MTDETNAKRPSLGLLPAPILSNRVRVVIRLAVNRVSKTSCVHRNTRTKWQLDSLTSVAEQWGTGYYGRQKAVAVGSMQRPMRPREHSRSNQYRPPLDTLQRSIKQQDEYPRQSQRRHNRHNGKHWSAHRRDPQHGEAAAYGVKQIDRIRQIAQPFVERGLRALVHRNDDPSREQACIVNARFPWPTGPAKPEKRMHKPRRDRRARRGEAAQRFPIVRNQRTNRKCEAARPKRSVANRERVSAQSVIRDEAKA